MFEIEAKSSVLKFVKKADSKTRERLRDVIITLKDSPVPVKTHDVAKLKGYDSAYRIRIGNLRLVYEVSWATKKITIHKIEPRESVYKDI